MRINSFDDEKGTITGISKSDGEEYDYLPLMGNNYITSDLLYNSQSLPLVLDATHLYVTKNWSSTPTTLVKINRLTHNVDLIGPTITIGSSGKTRSDSTHIYSYDSHGTHVYKISKTTLQVESTYTTTSDIYGFDIDETYAYIGTADGKILKVLKSTFAISATYTGTALAARICASDPTYLYAWKTGTGYPLVKITKSTLVDSLSLDTNINHSEAPGIIFDDLLISSDVRNKETLEVIHIKGQQNVDTPSFFVKSDGTAVSFFSNTLLEFDVRTGDAIRTSTYPPSAIYGAISLGYVLGDDSNIYASTSLDGAKFLGEVSGSEVSVIQGYRKI